MNQPVSSFKGPGLYRLSLVKDGKPIFFHVAKVETQDELDWLVQQPLSVDVVKLEPTEENDNG